LEKKGRLDGVLVFRLALLMQRLRPDIVSMHCRDAFHFGAPAALLARVRTRIATEHSVGSGTNAFLNKMGFRLFSPTWTSTIAVSEFLKDFMVRRWGIPEGRIEVIYNGVDFARLDAETDAEGGRIGLREQLGLSPQVPIVGNIGTLKKEKGHDVFLEVAAEIARKNESMHFVLIGDGPLMEPLRARVRELEFSERVHFMGSERMPLCWPRNSTSSCAPRRLRRSDWPRSR
jgi:glycosyltransferase involved in cell wall biosynthesis